MEIDISRLRADVDNLREDLEDQTNDAGIDKMLLSVLMDAVHAIIATHPDPEALLEAFLPTSPRPISEASPVSDDVWQQRIDAWGDVREAMLRALQKQRAAAPGPQQAAE